MSFVDPAFLFVFLPIVLVLFGVAGRFLGAAGACAVLIVSTLVFCVPFGWPFTLVVVTSALVNHLAFCALAGQRAGSTAFRVGILAGTLVFNFGVLAVIKYGTALEVIVPGSTRFFAFVMASVPVTVSFFTFQRTAMLFVAYQRRPEALSLATGSVGSHLRLGAFSSMFPNLVIGPIAYVSEVGKQLAREGFGRISVVNLQVGTTLVVIGLAKKLLIADPLDTDVVSLLFGAVDAGQPIVPLEAAAGMLGFYAQLYFDFSGYSDIAVGIARLFGLRLPINFNSPLRATGIVDFYKRWHITLTRVIARLLFTPLAVAGTRLAAEHRLRGLPARFCSSWIPFILNFVVIGIWHGAKWTYVAFGLYHGIWFIIESETRLTKLWKSFAKKTSVVFRLRAGQILIVVPLVISFALFRSDSIGAFGHLMASFGSDWLHVLSDPSGRVLNTRQTTFYLMTAFAIIWLCPNAYELMGKYRPGIFTWDVPSRTPAMMKLRWRPTLVWGVAVAALLMLAIGSLNAPTPFVYGGF